MTNDPDAGKVISVAIGRWVVATPPTCLRTLLGSCVGIVLHDRVARVGGLAHVVLPHSRGMTDQPGKYADTAIPALLADLQRAGAPTRRLAARLAGGASMFITEHTAAGRNIGRQNIEAVESIMSALGIPVLARDLGGDGGRNVLFDPASGRVRIRTPGGDDRDL